MKMCDHALNLVYQGFAVFPLHHIERWDVDPRHRCSCKDAKTGDGCENPGKHPRWEKGTLERGLHDATKEFLQVEKWWALWPNANIGIATGEPSGVFVIDVDGAAGKRSIRRLERQCGKMPDTLTAQTGKGYHLFFRSGGRGFKNRTGLLPGVDIRGDGGYVVAPPSVHVSKKRYRWEGDGLATAPPSYIIQLLIGGYPEPTERVTQRSDDDPILPWMLRPIPNGKRNNKLFGIALHWLRYENKTPEEVIGLLTDANQMKCRPPVKKSELVSIWESACKIANGRGKVKRTPPPAPFTHNETKGRKSMA